MMDYTETYTNSAIRPDNGDQVLLWVRYQGNSKGDCTITIKGAYNPLPFNKMVAFTTFLSTTGVSGFFPGNIWYTYELTGDKSGYRWQRSILKHWIPYNILLGIMM